jgi:hypothetical protein
MRNGSVVLGVAVLEDTVNARGKARLSENIPRRRLEPDQSRCGKNPWYESV